MLFDSAIYLVFLALVVLVYWRLSHGAQNRFLLAASYFFYGWWDWRFLLLMIASTAIDYRVGRAIASSQDPRHRRTLLVLSLILNFTILGYFKYCNFFIDSFVRLAGLLGAHQITHGLLNIILPPAISFYTFQEVAYIVDVYFGRVAAAESFVEYGLFISFFPHLIAGPIQRPSHLLPQVQRPRSLDLQRFYDGFMLILSGLFRKCVIADSCALLANAAFGGRMGSSGWVTLIGVYAFAWQIYGDFSGYSDIARGSAQLMGFHFMVNFRQPYLAGSLQDFWRRWHISLSTWLRDYLYIPLGGSRHGEAKTYRNLFTTMLLGGLWHGANWTFVFWGAVHGVVLAIERALGLAERVLPVWWRRILIFQIVCFAWIFFRAPSFGDAAAMLGNLAHWSWRPTYASALAYLAVFTLPLFAMDLRLENADEEYVFQRANFRWQVAAAGAAIMAVAFLADAQSNVFIYFQF